MCWSSGPYTWPSDIFSLSCGESVVRSDNTSTVYHVNHQGGVRSVQPLREAETFSLGVPSSSQSQGRVLARCTQPGCRHALPSGSASRRGLGPEGPGSLMSSCDQSVIQTLLSARAPSTRALYAKQVETVLCLVRRPGGLPGYVPDTGTAVTCRSC